MARGYSAAADILTRTRDGQDLNRIWDDFQSALDDYNATRQPLIDLLSAPVDSVIEDITTPGTERFEEASEFGIPVSIRPQPVTTPRAYPFKWYDLRQGYTWQFLANSSARQIDMVLQMAMEANNALEFEQVMKALFNDANRSASLTPGGTVYTVVALYNADGTVPPAYKGLTFAGSHTHYFTTGAAALDSTDLTDVAGTVEHHGFTRAQGYNIVLLVNPAEATVIQTFRRGVVNNNSQTSNYDFIPAQGANQALLLPPGYTLAGNQVPNEFAGLEVVGSWGPYLIVQDYQIPAGYVVAVATQGRATQTNVVGIREHENAQLRGMIQKPGNNNAYPLIDSYFIRGLGTGVRQRGAAAVMQVTASGSYSVPATYAW